MTSANIVYEQDVLKKIEKDRLKGHQVEFWNYADSLPKFHYQLALYLSKYLNDKVIVDHSKLGDSTKLMEYCDSKVWFNELLYQTVSPTTLRSVNNKEKYLYDSTQYIRQYGQKELKLNRLSRKFFLEEGITQYIDLLTCDFEEASNITPDLFFQLHNITVLCMKIVLIFAPLIDEACNPGLYKLVDKQNGTKVKYPIKADSYQGMYTFYTNLISIIHFNCAAIYRVMLSKTTTPDTIAALHEPCKSVLNAIMYTKMYMTLFNRQTDIFYDGLYINFTKDLIAKCWPGDELFSETNPFFTAQYRVNVTLPGHSTPTSVVQPSLFERYLKVLMASYENLYKYNVYMLSNGSASCDFNFSRSQSGSRDSDRRSSTYQSSQCLPTMTTPDISMAAAPTVILPGQPKTPIKAPNDAQDGYKPERSRIASFFRRKSVSNATQGDHQISTIANSSVINHGSVLYVNNNPEGTYGFNGAYIPVPPREFDYQSHLHNFMFALNPCRQYMNSFFDKYLISHDLDQCFHVLSNFLQLSRVICEFIRAHNDHLFVWFDQYFNYIGDAKVIADIRNIRYILLSTVYETYNKFYLDLKDDYWEDAHAKMYFYKLRVSKDYAKYLESNDFSLDQTLKNILDHTENAIITKQTADLVENYIILHDKLVNYEENMKRKHNYIKEQKTLKQPEKNSQKVIMLQSSDIPTSMDEVPMSSKPTSSSEVSATTSEEPTFAALREANRIKNEENTALAHKKIFVYNCIAVALLLVLCLFFHNTTIGLFKYGLPVLAILAVVNVALQYRQHKTEQATPKEKQKIA